MAYTNSALVNHTRISPNRNSPRKHAIDTITIHCVVGQVSVETLGNIFANPNRGASSNYGHRIRWACRYVRGGARPALGAARLPITITAP